jgi:hypothetical protein
MIKRHGSVEDSRDLPLEGSHENPQAGVRLSLGLLPDALEFGLDGVGELSGSECVPEVVELGLHGLGEVFLVRGLSLHGQAVQVVLDTANSFRHFERQQRTVRFVLKPF